MYIETSLVDSKYWNLRDFLKSSVAAPDYGLVKKYRVGYFLLLKIGVSVIVNFIRTKLY